jgi:hypothetical protein
VKPVTGAETLTVVSRSARQQSRRGHAAEDA